MINRLMSATLAIALVGSCGAIAVAASGGPGNASNAAISQYEAAVPIYESGVEGVQDHSVKEVHGGQGVKGAHEAGGKTHSGGGGPGSGTAGQGAHGGSAPVETAATGPVSAASGLPFTGYDALALAGVGLLLVLAGLAQRRFETKRHT